MAVRATAILLGMALAAAAAAQPLASRRVFLSGIAYELEIASDPPTRTRGLSGREAIDGRGGMLFVFPDDAPRVFWMRDCKIDIDIAFLDRSGRILSTHRMQVEPPRAAGESEQVYLSRLRQYPSLAPARFALELRAGSLSALGLAVGGLVDVTGIALPTQ